MNANPWIDLPTTKPFLLECDRPIIEGFNRRASDYRRLRVDDLLPEPFIGNSEAPVLLLSNNPGFGKAWKVRAQPDFMQKVRLNLSHQLAESPFYYLGENVGDANRVWWERKLKWLIERFDCDTVARSILNVVYFPYPSKKYRHDKLRVPSQSYGFELVRDAMRRGAFIVFMRKQERWFTDVPELKVYKRKCQVCNTQNPIISRGNLDDFELVVKAIAAYAAKKT